MDNLTSAELIDTIEGVAMSLDDFEQFMSERLALKVTRPSPPPILPRPEPRDGYWHVEVNVGGVWLAAGIVTALRVGDHLSVAVYRHGLMFRMGEEDAEGNVVVYDDGTLSAASYAQEVAQTLRDGLRAVGALPIPEPTPAQAEAKPPITMESLDTAISGALLDAGRGYTFQRQEIGPRIVYTISYTHSEVARVEIWPAVGWSVPPRYTLLADTDDPDAEGLRQAAAHITRHICENVNRVHGTGPYWGKVWEQTHQATEPTPAQDGESRNGNDRPPVTATTHTLPFDKLSPRDFERLCLWLVEREGYERAEHLGAAGSEQGRDIIAWREDRQWAFQCKRVQRFGPKGALAEVEKVLTLPQTERPVGLVFVVTCNVSDNTRRQVRRRCAGEMECHFWTGTEFDEKVKRHPDLLQEFFHISERRE